MTETPLVTVYIPTYNRRALLERALESVLNQTYTNIEVIIVDDCSPDDTLDYLAQVAQKYSRVRYFQNEKNSGACVSRNKAIIEAKGEFVTGLDDDDYFLPGRIEQFVTKWPMLKTKHPDMICLFSNFSVKRDPSAEIKLKEYKKPKVVRQKDLLISNPIGILFFSKVENLKKIMFDENLLAWQDLDFCYRLLGFGVAVNVEFSTYVIDISHDNQRISSGCLIKVEESFDYLVKKYSLSPIETDRLRIQYVNYDLRRFSFLHVFLLFLKTRSFFSLKVLARKIFFSLLVGKSL